jgi:hypothetical protein
MESPAVHFLCLMAIADLSAKAYSHNRHRVQRHLCPVWQADARPSQEARVDTGLHGRARGDGPEFHLRLGEWPEGNLHSQFGTTCHCFWDDPLETDVAPLAFLYFRFNRAPGSTSVPEKEPIPAPLRTSLKREQRPSGMASAGS